MNKRQKIFWALLGLCVCMLFLFLGETPFHTKGEPREAVVALSMLERGNWILPVNNGVDIAYKPPLFHWMIAVSSLLFGTVTEYTARFPSAFMLMVMLLAGYGFYARRKGTELALVTTLLTLTNFEVHRAGINCRVDMVLAAFMVLALYLLYLWYERGVKGLPWLAILCLSGAALTKGPVGIVLPCLVAFVFLWIRGYRFLFLVRRFIGIGLLACVLPGCWYLAAWKQGGDRFLSLVVEENLLRFMGKMTYASHENPAYYNILTLLAGFLPYTLFVVLSLFFLKYKNWNINLQAGWQKLVSAIKNMDDVRLYTFLCAVLIFVFYCIPKSKRSVYLLPMYPFVAYFLAEYFIYLRDRHSKVLQISGYMLCVVAVLPPLLFLLLRLMPVPDFLLGGRHPEETRQYIEALQQLPLSPFVVCLWLLPVFAVLNFCYTRYKRQPVRLLPLFAMVVTVFIALDGFYQPPVLSVKSDKPMAREIASIVPEGRLYSYRSEFTPGNRMHPFTLNFYLGDRIVPFDEFLPSQGFLIMGEQERKPFLETYGSDYVLQDVYNSNRRSCDDGSVVHVYEFYKKAR